MIKLFTDWYKLKFSDPNAVALVLILVGVFLLFALFSNILMPVFVAIAVAFLLDLPTNKLVDMKLSRLAATIIVVSVFISFSLLALLGLMPIIWQQSSTLLQEVPSMFAQGQTYLLTLPDKYPEIFQASQIETFISSFKDKMLEWGELVLKASLNSLSNLVALLIYLILVPLMVFFFLKDKKDILANFSLFIPKERKMARKVGKEMNQQVLNYIRGKVIEIIIVGASTTLAFVLLGLNYAVLLGLIVGLSVLVPYVGATVVTIPVFLVALFQWGFGNELGYVMLAYGLIQAIDGNLIVPLLFSEAVNLHPVTIIIAVIFFGGLWGFWGVFFAIPLATLVKAVINAWPSGTQEQVVEPS
ncbi:MAG: AI-2E family transporter [Colwellia sp.]